MGRLAVGIVGAIVVVIGGMSTQVIGEQQPPPWNQCCGTTPWPMGPGMMRGGMMGPGMMGSMPRHGVILDRAYGKAPQAVRLDGELGIRGKLVIND